MATKTKTWKQLHDELGTQMRRWGVSVWSVESLLAGRYATRSIQSVDERAVTLTFRKWTDTAGLRAVTLIMRREMRAIENLEALVKAVEHLRMAEVRGIDQLLVFAYRQLDPATPQETPPPRMPGSAPQIPEHYRRLGVLPSCPLAVAEAAYKALARAAHPDAGGTTLDMQHLNAAIERIRKEKAR